MGRQRRMIISKSFLKKSFDVELASTGEAMS